MALLGQREVEDVAPELEVEGWAPRMWRGKRPEIVLRPDPEPWVALYQLRLFGEALEQLRTGFVAQCRAEGFDWGTIATAIGESRATVARRYTQVDELPEVAAAYRRVVEDVQRIRAGLPPLGQSAAGEAS